jgi:VWFA-related protein
MLRLLLIPVAAAATLAAQAPPQFRSRVDLVHLDVSVLDQNRRPVRGLGPADFTIFENGQPQKVAVFSAVDIPPVEPPRAAWMRDVAPDVRTNEGVSDRRLFLILIDDSGVELDTFAMKQMKMSARGIVDRLGPSDLAAIVFTLDNRNSIDYTADRASLLRAVDSYNVGARGMTRDGELGPMADWLFLNYSIGTIERAVEVLAELPDRRKSVFYVGQGVAMDSDRWHRLKRAF